MPSGASSHWETSTLDQRGRRREWSQNIYLSHLFSELGTVHCILQTPDANDLMWGTFCYGLNVFLPPRSYVKTLNPSVMTFGSGVFREVIRFRSGYRGGAPIMSTMPLNNKRKNTRTLSLSLSPSLSNSLSFLPLCHMRTHKKWWPSLSQKEGSH